MISQFEGEVIVGTAKFRRLCLLAGLSASLTGVGAQSAFAQSQTPAFVMSDDLYGRLVVDVKYDDGNRNEIDGCPTEGYDLRDFAGLLQADRTLSLGVSITNPGGTTVVLEPTSIETKLSSIFFFWQRPVCKMRLDSLTYLSPLYPLSSSGAASFMVSPSIRQRDKPAEQIVAATREFTSRALSLSTSTAALAEPLSRYAYAQMDVSGTNITSSRGQQLFFNRSPNSANWDTTIALDPKGKKTIPVHISAHFENVASVFSTTATSLDGLKLDDADLILGQHLVPVSAIWTPDNPSVEQQLSRSAPDDYRAFIQAKTGADLDSACNRLSVTLNNTGFTPTDRAVILWALARLRGLGGSADADQIHCLQGRKALLEAVGATLRPPLPPPPPTTRFFPATTEAMKAAVASNTGDADNLVAFFKSATARVLVAPTLFQYPVDLTDPNNIILPAQQRPVSNRDAWAAWAIRPNEAFFTNFGCYRYDNAGTVFAKARASANDRETDFAVELTFKTIVTTTNGVDDTVTRITAVKLVPLENTPATFSCAS